MRIKHPYGFRLRRRQTPSGPSLNVSSQKIVGTKTMSKWFIQNLWFPSVNWRTSPSMAHGLGASSNTIVRNRCLLWVEQLPIKTNGCKPADHLVHCSSHILGDQWPKSIGHPLRQYIFICAISYYAFLVNKALSFFKGNLVAQHVIRSTSELMRHSHARNHHSLLR